MLYEKESMANGGGGGGIGGADGSDVMESL